jgi:hypothetical protein
MERLSFRSTSIVDLQAELHERDLLREARRPELRRPRPRKRGIRHGLTLIGRRLLGVTSGL